MKIIEICRAEGLTPGTFEVLKNLEKLGVISIVEVRSYNKIELYDCMEDMEKSYEYFEVAIDRTDDNPIDGFSPIDFTGRMLNGLGISMSYERVKG